MIGLRRHTVRVVEHRPEWAALFAEAAEAIRQATAGLHLQIEHVGSTAVPGLPAKPILDITVAVRQRAEIAEVVRRLTPLGYMDRGDGGNEGGWLLVKESAPEVRTIHLHIVEETDPQWRNYLAFRDRLRNDATLREQYAELKRRLGASFPNDRKAYTAAKHEFIRAVLRP